MTAKRSVHTVKPARAGRLSWRQWLIGGLAAIILFAAGFVVNGAWLRWDVSGWHLVDRSGRPSLSQFWNVYDLLHQKYDGTINNQTLATGAIRGEVAALGDPYTEYLTAAEARDLTQQLQGNLSGVGIEVGIKNNRLSVIAPIDGTPAAKAGIRAGDVIAAVDGTDSSTLTLDEAVARIRGQAGSHVTLTIIRGTTTLKLDLTRQNLTIQSVSSHMQTDDIGYIRIRQFGNDTADGIQKTAADLKAAGARGIILDLRDNPGGYLDAAVSTVSQFLKSGVVVSEKGKATGEDHTYYASGDGVLTTVPMVVLINGGSASAAEITAGALHDSGRATLVGEKTFGKGVVQEVLNLDGGNELKVTVAKWYTPHGTNINEQGIKPDVQATNTDADFSAGRDPQLDRATQVLQTKL